MKSEFLKRMENAGIRMALVGFFTLGALTGGCSSSQKPVKEPTQTPYVVAVSAMSPTPYPTAKRPQKEHESPALQITSAAWSDPNSLRHNNPMKQKELWATIVENKIVNGVLTQKGLENAVAELQRQAAEWGVTTLDCEGKTCEAPVDSAFLIWSSNSKLTQDKLGGLVLPTEAVDLVVLPYGDGPGRLFILRPHAKDPRRGRGITNASWVAAVR